MSLRNERDPTLVLQEGWQRSRFRRSQARYPRHRSLKYPARWRLHLHSQLLSAEVAGSKGNARKEYR
jgi:hypothetical protein